MSTDTLQNVLVDTEWAAQHATDAGVRVVEVDVDTTACDGSWTEWGNLVGAPVEKP